LDQKANADILQELKKQNEEMREALKTLTQPKTSVDRATAEFYSMGRDKWLGAGTPWFTEGAKAWLEANILPTDKVLEFGGGRSTIFWASRAERVTSVEASPDWFLWIYMQLYNNPEMMKRVRLHFVPCEWNPNFDTGRRRYWTENRQSLNTEDIVNLERDLITAYHPGNNVLLFDGSLRGPVFVYQISKANFDEVDLIVIDNTELPFNCYSGDYMIPKDFVRFDFIAGSKDEIPKHQNGKHITTVFVKEDRAKRSKVVTTETSTSLKKEDRHKHLLGDPMTEQDFIDRLKGISRTLNRLVGGGFEPRLF
jgi:hypothetical protein